MAIYLFGLAEMTGIDLQVEIEQKLQKNAARRYERDSASGVLQRVEDA